MISCYGLRLQGQTPPFPCHPHPHATRARKWSSSEPANLECAGHSRQDHPGPGKTLSLHQDNLRWQAGGKLNPWDKNRGALTTQPGKADALLALTPADLGPLTHFNSFYFWNFLSPWLLHVRLPPWVGKSPSLYMASDGTLLIHKRPRDSLPAGNQSPVYHRRTRHEPNNKHSNNIKCTV